MVRRKETEGARERGEEEEKMMGRNDGKLMKLCETEKERDR